MLTLKNILTINALSSGATGLLLIAYVDLLSRWFGIRETLLLAEVGVFLIAFAVFVIFVSRKKKNESLVKVVIALDVAWVITSVLVLAIGNAFISGLGVLLIAAVACWVALMAFLQHRGLKTFVAVFFVTVLSSSSAWSQTSNPDATRIAPLSNSKKSIEVVKNFIAAIQTDHKKIPALLDSAMTWHQPGNNQLSGVRNNLTEVYQLFAGFNQLSAGTLTLADWKILGVNGNQVACRMRWKAAQPTGRVLDVDNIDVYTIHGGKITRVVVYTSDPEQEDTFWMK